MMEINDKLKYEGWQKMNSILDKEMPVKRKNKLFYYLLVFFAVFTFGAGLYWGLVNDKRSVEAPAKTGMNTSPVERKESLQPQVLPKDIKQSQPVNSEQNINTIKTLQKRNYNNVENVNHKQNQKAKRNLKRNNDKINTPNVWAHNIKNIESSSFQLENKKLFLELPKIKNTSKLYVSNEDKKKMTPAIYLGYYNNNSLWKYVNPYLGLNVRQESFLPWTSGLELTVGNRFVINKRYFVELGMNITKAEYLYNTIVEKYDKSKLENNADRKRKDEITKYKDIEYIRYNGIDNLFKHSVIGIHLNHGLNLNNRFAFVLGTGVFFTKKINDIVNDNFDSYAGSNIYLGYMAIPEYTYTFSFAMDFKAMQNFHVGLGYNFYIESNRYDMFYTDGSELSNFTSNKHTYYSTSNKLINAFINIKYILK